MASASVLWPPVPLPCLWLPPVEEGVSFSADARPCFSTSAPVTLELDTGSLQSSCTSYLTSRPGRSGLSIVPAVP